MRIFEIQADLSVVEGISLTRDPSGHLYVPLGMRKPPGQKALRVRIPADPRLGLSPIRRGNLRTAGTSPGPLWLVPEGAPDDGALVISRVRPGIMGSLQWRGDPSKPQLCLRTGERRTDSVLILKCEECGWLYSGSSGCWVHPVRHLDPKFDLPVAYEGRCSAKSELGLWSWGEKVVSMRPGDAFEMIRGGDLEEGGPASVVVRWNGTNLAVT